MVSKGDSVIDQEPITESPNYAISQCTKGRTRMGKVITQFTMSLDEIHIDLGSILLGVGIRLFDQLGPNPIDLEIMDVIEGTGVTHLRYRVIK